jgi:hypothetical protein
MITLTREEAQQVLIALKMYGAYTPSVIEAIELLRARLAQPEPEPEPVAWLYMGIKQDGTTHGPHLCWKPEYMDVMSENKGAVAEPLYTLLPKPKLNVKPAAYVPVHPKSGPLWSMTTDDPNTERLPSYPLMNLYTAPPQREWQRLTDEEIHNTGGYREDRELYWFARTIEAKLREKNT